MAKIKLHLNLLNPEQLAALGLQVKTAMTGNANFTTPNPSLAALATGITTAQAKIAAYNSSLIANQNDLTDRDAALAALRALLRQEAAYVENIANGDASIILSAGMQVQSARSLLAPPPMVQGVVMTASENAGTVNLHWDPLKTTRTYEVEVAADNLFTTGVIRLRATTKAKAVADGLTSGSRIWARVRATNSAGTGAWSDPATKIVP